MTTIVATVGVLTAAVIEITGIPALIALLVPVAVLVFVIVRLARMAPPSEPPPEKNIETLHAIPGEAISKRKTKTVQEKPRPVDWASRIRSAEASSDRAALASLYLSFAQDEIAQGKTESAAEHLRESVRAAAKSKNAAVQAEARLELAELARASGDLTTACEHWQLARALFHELKQNTRLGDTETLMRKHGCPTDWVLNDF